MRERLYILLRGQIQLLSRDPTCRRGISGLSASGMHPTLRTPKAGTFLSQVTVRFGSLPFFFGLAASTFRLVCVILLFLGSCGPRASVKAGKTPINAGIS